MKEITFNKREAKATEALIEMQIEMKENGFLPILKIELDTYPIRNFEDFLEELQKTRKNDIRTVRKRRRVKIQIL